MSKHKHHIIPRYKCEELNIDPDFPENIVEVTREDHALIHWGYKCNDLEPLFKYVKPEQWIIDLIPIGDNRDVGAAVLTARGEIDGIDISGENNPMWGKTGESSPNWKGGLATNDIKTYMKEYEKKPERKAYKKKYYKTPEYKAFDHKRNQTPKRKAQSAASTRRYRARKKTETQGEGTLKAFL